MTVGDFITAFNNNESDLTDRFFAPAPTWRFFFDPDRIEPAAYDRDSLDAHLATLQDQGHRWDVVSVSTVPDTATSVGFLIEFVRRDVDGDGLVKGVIDCDSGLIMMWVTEHWE